MALIETVFQIRRKLRTRLHTLALRGAFHSFGRGSRIVPPFRGGNLGRVRVGEDVYVGEGCWIEAIRGHAPGGDPLIVLGDHARLGMDITITAARSVVIEEHAAIARNTFISDHSHGFRDPDVPVILQGVDRVAPVRICRGAWLGHGVVVLPGVTIGRNAVVGANAVVTADVPDRCVAVGSPARIVRRFDWRTGRWEKSDGAMRDRETAWRRSSEA